MLIISVLLRHYLSYPSLAGRDNQESNDYAAIENELVDSITSYCGLIRDAKTTVFSIQSATRISDQHKVEQIRYDKGAGLKTDLLEVAAQLSGAKARVITTKASLVKSENNYLAVFHEVPGYFEFASIPPTLPAQFIITSGFLCLINLYTLS